MIFNVIWTMFLFRGASSALGNLPYASGAFISIGVGNLLDGLSHSALEVLEGIGLLLHIGVMLVFLIFVLNSKHLHIFVAPLNVLFGRRPVALGAVKPMISAGKPLTLDDIEDLDEDARLGVGSIEDFTWKGLLDFTTCTECGRCQSQCPAWNTEKPLSPKLLIMELRDHAMAAAPAMIADEGRPARGPAGRRRRRGQGARAAADRRRVDVRRDRPRRAVVLHVLRRLRATSARSTSSTSTTSSTCAATRCWSSPTSPAELNQLFKGLEGRGNPWNMSASGRHGLGQGPRLRGPGRRRGPRVDGRGRLAVLDRLRRRLRGPRQEDDPRRRRAARPGRRLLRRARQRRDLHRRPRTPCRQRVRLPGPGRAEHRDLDASTRSRRSSRPAPTA